MQQGDLQIGKDLFLQPLMFGRGSANVEHVALFDQGIDDVGLAAGVDLAVDEVVETLAVSLLEELGRNWRTARRHFVDGTDVEVAVDGERQAPRDGSRAHDQQVRLALGLAAQHATLFDAKTVLLVDDGKPQVGEFDGLLDQGRRAHDDVDRAVCQAFKHLLAAFAE